MANSNNTEDREKDKSLVDELIEILPYNSPPTLELLLRVLSLLPVEVIYTYIINVYKIVSVSYLIINICNHFISLRENKK